MIPTFECVNRHRASWVEGSKYTNLEIHNFIVPRILNFSNNTIAVMGILVNQAVGPPFNLLLVRNSALFYYNLQQKDDYHNTGCGFLNTLFLRVLQHQGKLRDSINLKSSQTSYASVYSLNYYLSGFGIEPYNCDVFSAVVTAKFYNFENFLQK